jgi:hypothetical protein
MASPRHFGQLVKLYLRIMTLATVYNGRAASGRTHRKALHLVDHVVFAFA